MKKHKIFVDEIMEEIRGLAEYYQLSYEDGDVFELDSSELKPFKEELLATVKRFLEQEELEEVVDEDEDDDEDFSMFLLDDDDDLS